MKHHESPHAWRVCLAERQTQGRGRLGRTWHSPQGGNLYTTLRLMLPCSMKHLGELSLVVGLGLLATFKKIGLTYAFQLKWPNDILFCGQKLGGVLIEILEIKPHQTTVLIGVGLNLTFCPSAEVVEQMTTSLHQIHSSPIDRNNLMAHFMVMVDRYIQRYVENGWEIFREEYEGSLVARN